MAKKREGAKAGRGKEGSSPPSEGTCWVVPVPKMGFCPFVVARGPHERPEVDFVFAYLNPVLLESPPDIAAVGSPEEWRRAWIGLLPSLPFRNGRWRLVGHLPTFERAAWPVPPSRSSAVDENEAVEKWGREPWGEMWSIETTADEPTMTVIANTPATREEALGFPQIDVTTSASRFEQALATHFKARQPGFWEMEVKINEVPRGAIGRWQSHAEGVRAAYADVRRDWLPAGRKTDRELRAGAWLALPLQGGGFGAAMLVAKPEVQHRIFADAVVMGMRRRWNDWPRLEDVVGLRPEDGALVVQTSMICVRDGRWRVLGYDPAFDPSDWIWPLPWWQNIEQKASGRLAFEIDRKRTVEVQMDPAVLALDPVAGERCRGSSSYGSVELDIPRIMQGTHWAQTRQTSRDDAIVTPDRLRAWRAIDRAILEAVAARGS